MEQAKGLQIIETIDRIYEQAKDCRKHEIDSILNGDTYNIENIIRYCDTETFNIAKQPIGFIKN